VPQCTLWFMKFSCDFHFNQLAVGNIFYKDCVLTLKLYVRLVLLCKFHNHKLSKIFFGNYDFRRFFSGDQYLFVENMVLVARYCFFIGSTAMTSLIVPLLKLRTL
jgi:hypothetical protein